MQVLDQQSQTGERVENQQVDLESKAVSQLKARNDWRVHGLIRQNMMI